MKIGGLVYSRLRLVCSDGREVDLLSEPNGILLKDWRPSIQKARDGGVYSESSLADGRKLVLRKLENAVETFTLSVRANSQDETIEYINDLIDLLETGVTFWTTRASQTPVWIEAQAPKESGRRYAAIKNYTLSDLNNPFSQPFFSISCKNTMDDIVLSVERGEWLAEPPESPSCVEIDASVVNAKRSCRAFVTSSTYDAYVVTPAYYSSSTNWLRVGSDNSTWPAASNNMHTGLFFYGLDIPQGATILSAYISLSIRAESTNGPRSYMIYANDVNDCVPFSTYADFMGVVLTTAKRRWNRNGVAAKQGTRVNTPSIVSVVQEVIDRPGWASNNSMRFYIMNTQETADGCWSEFFSWDWYNKNPSNRGSFRPKLNIIYSGSTGISSVSCESGGYIINGINLLDDSAVDYLYVYDASAGTYTNLIGTALPQTLFPDPPATADYVYFGSGRRFTNLIFDIETPNSNTTGFNWHWEYSQGGGSWATFMPGFEFADDTVMFEEDGVNRVQWLAQSDWATDTVNGVSRYWVRINIDAVAAADIPTQQNQDVFTVRWPGVEIPAENITGTLSALADLDIVGECGYTDGVLGPGAPVSRVYVAIVPETRFPDYQMFVNLLPSSAELQPGVHDIHVIDAAHTGEVSSPVSSAGALLIYDPAGYHKDLAKQFYLELLSTGFFGKYHVFVRARASGTVTANEFSIQVRTYTGYTDEDVYFESQIAYNKWTYGTAHSPKWEVYDLGIIPIPADCDRERQSQLVPGSYSRVDFLIGADLGADYLYLQDVVFVPVFEENAFLYTDHATYLSTPGAVSLWDGYTLSIDSASDLRQTVRVQLFRDFDDQALGDWDRSLSGPLTFHTGVRQSISVFGFGNDFESDVFTSQYDTLFSIRVRAIERYFGMRGQR